MKIIKKRKHKKDLFISKQFEDERQTLLKNSVSIGALIAATLVPLFGLLDLLSKPHQLGPFFTIRLFVTVISIGVYYLCKSQFGEKHSYILGAFLTLIVGGSISLMCRLDLGPSDPYYAGINLSLIAFGFLLPLTLFEGIIVFSLAWLTYFIPNMLILTPHDTALFISNNFFIISTIIISLVSSQFFLNQRRKQCYTHYRLQSAHKKIKKHADELEKLVQERTQKLLQTERLAVVGQLAGGIAHDFNNILTVILGNSDLILQSMPQKDPNRIEVEGISRIGQRASELVKKLLAFSRRQLLMPKELNLNEVISEVKVMLTRTIGEDINLVANLHENLKYIQADPIQIEQIILNLCVNARDAMPQGGKLLIETSNVNLDTAYCKERDLPLVPGDYIMLSISDTGKGMNNTVKSKIFEPFFTTKEKGHGTGLGLSSVFGIVKQSHGDIIVYSEEGKGTIFKIYFPAIIDNMPRNKRKRKISKKQLKGTETILLVEDEEDVRRLTARMLQTHGYNIIEAREGTEAIEFSNAFEKHIDLLLTDLVMPNMTGKDLADILLNSRKDMKVLYLSGYTHTILESQGMIDIKSSFLQKPYTSEILMKKIRNLFDMPKSVQARQNA